MRKRVAIPCLATLCHRKGSALVERRERLQARLKARQIRLKAWWKGYHPHLPKVAVVEGEERTTTAAPEVAPSIPVELVEESIEGAKPNPWSRERLLLLAELWGSGFTSPGGQEFGMELVKPLAPNSKMSLLNLNATLGGTARTIANAYQMWVNAFEPNETLALIGMEMSTRGGLAKRAPIEFCDHEHLRERLKQDGRQYDSIFAKEGFFKVEPCPSSKHLGHLGLFLNGGSGVMVVDVKRLGVGAPSVVFRRSVF